MDVNILITIASVIGAAIGIGTAICRVLSNMRGKEMRIRCLETENQTIRILERRNHQTIEINDKIRVGPGSTIHLNETASKTANPETEKARRKFIKKRQKREKLHKYRPGDWAKW